MENLPWTTSRYFGGDDRWLIRDSNGRNVCDVIEHGPPIVRAVNSHAQLIEALENAIELIEREVSSTASKHYFPPKDHQILRNKKWVVSRHFPAKEYDIDAMRAALSAAKGEKS